MEPTAIGRLMISYAGGASRTNDLQITMYDWPGENATFSPGLYLAGANTASFVKAEVNQLDQRRTEHGLI